MRRMTDEGLDLIKLYEGYSSSPYLCPAQHWTIGYGAIWGMDDKRVTEDHPDINEDQADYLLRRDVITKVMCDFELDFDWVEQKYKIDFEKYFAYALSNFGEMIDDGLVTIEKRKLTISEMGRLMIRNVAMNFDGYIERKQDTARYSRTV